MKTKIEFNYNQNADKIYKLFVLKSYPVYDSKYSYFFDTITKTLITTENKWENIAESKSLKKIKQCQKYYNLLKENSNFPQTVIY